MRIILGLGNPGSRYARTRHNVRFMALERLAASIGVRLRAGSFPAPPLEEARAHAFGEDLVLARPMTFMNRSGEAARALAARHGGAPEEFVVLYDDVALPLGRLRLRARGSSGGHRGMESVIEHLGTSEIPRLRLGILGASAGEKPDDLPEFVLEEFANDEWGVVEQMLDRSVEALGTAVTRGIEVASSLYNSPEKPVV